MSERVGPIVFSHPVARDQLLTAGIVATARDPERTTGRTWARWERTGEKKADVEVRKVCDTKLADPDDLPYFSFATYAKWSGFGTPEAWAEAVREMHGDVDEIGVFEAELVYNDELACVSCGATAPGCICEGAECPNCHGRGYIINCVDDLCHARGSCMHGDDKDCARCRGRGVVVPKRVPWSDREEVASA